MIRKHFLRPLLMASLSILLLANKAVSQITIWYPGHAIGPVTGKYNFSSTQTPDQLVELLPAYIFISGGAGYQWQQSSTPLESGFTDISGATSTSYTFPAGYHLPGNMYYRRKTYSISTPSNLVYSNIIKLSLVLSGWEDLNYIRHHDVQVTGMTDAMTVDQLPIGQKMQTTTYLDGLGRPMQTIAREMATPATVGGAWGDIVQFTHYDALGREPVRYLSYTTLAQPGKFKTSPITDQAQYYLNTYNETSAFNNLTLDNSPLNRSTNIKEAGQRWAASVGSTATYDFNTTDDAVRLLDVDYVQGNPPVSFGINYGPGTLHKTTYTDVNNTMVVEFTDDAGRTLLRKVQVDAVPSAGDDGWACTYSVYDQFGQLRFQIQPEGVKYLDANNWSFAGTNGQTVLNEQVFQYMYDEKGRQTWKKSPGAAPVTMIYDSRDRVVFMQDGNQAALPTPQWRALLYDDLDRLTTTVLYNTTATAAQLQSDINNAVTVTNISVPSYTPPTADQVYTTRTAGVLKYIASHSITFNPGFASLTSDQFTAYIDPSPASQGYTGTSITLGSPISAANLANSAVCNIIKYEFYDSYAFTGVKSFDNNFTNTTAYSTSDPNVMPIVTSPRTISMPTGARTLVLGTSTWLNTTYYYDDKGRHIQTLEDNIKGGTDIVTTQHHFSGHTLSTCESHTAPGTAYTGFITLTKYLFDKISRVTAIQKQYGSNPLKTISTFDLDDAGRIKTMHLDPGYNNPNSGLPDLESMNYTFNIHGQMTGINKDYALKTAGSYNKWGHFFGNYIGYDNRDNMFTAPQLNGQIAGQIWNTQGDDAQRKYEYTYDNAGRLVKAAFNEQQHPGDGWSNTKTDFTVGGVSGQITYDLNGNLLTMLQKGVIPGSSAPITVDDLRYTYNAYSNKLQSVTDQMTTTSANGQSGDFKDGANAAGTPDYVYDNNGNVVIDLNKNVQSLNNGAAGTNGIHYNFMDRPDQVRVVGKGTIKIVYSADGEKLQRVFIPEAGGNSTITSYLGDYVYQETAPLTLTSPAPFSGSNVNLAYINFENGRIRVVTPTSQGNGLDGLTENGNLVLPNGMSGAWDYFIMDQQKNVRMILTEETHSAVNTCTLELTGGRPAAEDPVFGQTGGANEVETTRVPTPAGWQSFNTSGSVSSLGNLSGHIIGPNTLQKVMAGDQVTASVQYYYQGTVTNSNPNIIPNILNSLGAALAGSATTGTIVHGNSAAITSQLGANPVFVNAVEPTGSGGTTPQAFLTILFFDERFNLIPSADGGIAQQQVASSWTSGTPPLGLTNIKAPKNGYVYVYVSNRSDQPVYFDNLAVGVVAGNIIEENHYYAYGLKIAGISSRKLGDPGEGKLKNPYLYNDKELEDEDADLGWQDYGFRDYDPQTGRFMQQDLLTDQYPQLSPYQYAGDDPVMNIDNEGLDIVDAVGKGVEVASDVFQNSKTIDQIAVFVTAVRPAAAGVKVGKIALGVVNIAIKSAIIAGNAINNLVPIQVGGDREEIFRRGMQDAMSNANTFGLRDLVYTLFRHDPLDDYDDDEDKLTYLRGRYAGDLLSTAQGAFEQFIGNNIAGYGLIGGPTTAAVSLAGVAVSLHGTGVSITATANAGIVLAKILLIQAKTKAKMKVPEKQYKPPPSTFDPNVEGKSHHISTWTHKTYWTEKFQELFDKAGLNIRTAKENIVKVINHFGPHPDEYHEYIYNSLLKATKNARNDAEFKELFIKELKRLGKLCQTPGTKLNKWLTTPRGK